MDAGVDAGASVREDANRLVLRQQISGGVGNSVVVVAKTPCMERKPEHSPPSSVL